MTQDDSEAMLLVRKRKQFAETYGEVRAWKIPVSDRFPDGVKYGMQFGERDGGTIFRYDNFPDHLGASHHHKHLADGSVVGVDFTGVFDLYEQFKQEIRDHGEYWD